MPPLAPVCRPAHAPLRRIHTGKVLPPASWRPYPQASIWKPIVGVEDGSAGSPSVHADSTTIVGKMMAANPAQILPGQDSSATKTLIGVTHPTYYATMADPVFEARRRTDVGNSSPFWTTSAGPLFHCPQNALPSDGADAHFAVVQPDGTEWFIYDSASTAAGAALTALPGGGGIIYGTGLAKHTIGGDGIRLGGDGTGTAAGFGSLYGVIRPEEMFARRINHALFMTANWSDGTFVAPAVALARRKAFVTNGSHTFPITAGTITVVATTNASATGSVRLPNGSLVTYTGITGTTFTGCNGGTGGVLGTGQTLHEHYWPPCGARLQLNLTSAQIQGITDSSNATGRWWNKVFLEALRTYGAFIGDTGGGTGGGFHIAAGYSQLSLAGVDPWRTWAAATSPAMTYDAAADCYFWDIRTVINGLGGWASCLRVLDWTDPLNH